MHACTVVQLWYVLGCAVGICYEGELRLTGGSSPTEGRVEVCIEGMWGTVCDSSWEAKDAEVACRQAGYLSVGKHWIYKMSTYWVDLCVSLFLPDAIAHSVPMFGGALGGVHLTEVQCVGDESELVDCHHKKTHNCSLRLNAGVICEGELKLLLLPSISITSYHLHQRLVVMMGQLGWWERLAMLEAG